MLRSQTTRNSSLTRKQLHNNYSPPQRSKLLINMCRVCVCVDAAQMHGYDLPPGPLGPHSTATGMSMTTNNDSMRNSSSLSQLQSTFPLNGGQQQQHHNSHHHQSSLTSPPQQQQQHPQQQLHHHQLSNSSNSNSLSHQQQQQRQQQPHSHPDSGDSFVTTYPESDNDEDDSMPAASP